MRKCRDFQPEDFEIEDELTMRKHIKKKTRHIFDDDEEDVKPAKQSEEQVEVTQNKVLKKMQISIESMDQTSLAETENEYNTIKPYSKTIAYFKLILTKKMAPVDKLFSFQEGWNIFFDEIADYQKKYGSKKIEGIG